MPTRAPAATTKQKAKAKVTILNINSTAMPNGLQPSISQTASPTPTPTPMPSAPPSPTPDPNSTLQQPQNNQGNSGGGGSPSGGGAPGGGGGQPQGQQQPESDHSNYQHDSESGGSLAGSGGGNCSCSALQNSSGGLGDAVKEMQKYRASCLGRNSSGRSGLSEKMALNDYRGSTGCMYILDADSGTCTFATPAAYGTGGGVPPQPGCDGESHQTPAGFHVTARHEQGSRYGPNNSLLMVGLQNQGSAGRGILIHQGSCQGGACSWGCSGVTDFERVKSELGEGALVYNFFGGKVGNCSAAGNPNVCSRDGGGSGSSVAPPNRNQNTRQ